MPMIDLTLPKGTFERAEQEALAAELTRLIIPGKDLRFDQR